MHITEPEKLPPKKYQRVIEELAGLISDPAQKLKFLKLVITKYQEISKDDTSSSVPTEFSRPLLITISVVTVFFILSIGILVLSYIIVKKGEKIETATILDQKQDIYIPIIYPPVSRNENPEVALHNNTINYIKVHPQTYPKYLNKLIWQVEKTDDSEKYSNRLKIITTHTTSNIPRKYYKFLKDTPQLPTKDMISDKIMGILYHASESDIYAFRPEMTESIKEYSKAMVRYLYRKKAYHYFIDRFGQVYRVVKEEHAAFHGGNSVWADEKSIYLDLNHAFIGICFEGKGFEKRNKPLDNSMASLNPPSLKPMDTTSINEAQLVSGKELTDWLRVKYNISQENCVPHSLASINPYNLLIGHHLDLSYSFPFDQYELSNKYIETIPAITEFGLSCDDYFKEIFDGNIWPGIKKSEDVLIKNAQEYNMSFNGYRKLLNKRFTSFFYWQKKRMGKLHNNNSP